MTVIILKDFSLHALFWSVDCGFPGQQSPKCSELYICQQAPAVDQSHQCPTQAAPNQDVTGSPDGSRPTGPNCHPQGRDASV